MHTLARSQLRSHQRQKLLTWRAVNATTCSTGIRKLPSAPTSAFNIFGVWEFATSTGCGYFEDSCYDTHCPFFSWGLHPSHFDVLCEVAGTSGSFREMPDKGVGLISPLASAPTGGRTNEAIAAYSSVSFWGSSWKILDFIVHMQILHIRGSY